jgi:nucleotide-binding universal stress UspA family protein
MKNIVVPTDYSESASNALHYAAAIAKAVKGRVILLHAFPYPIVTDLPPDVLQQFVDETIADHLGRLNEIKKSIEKQYGIEVACKAEAGSVVHNLLEVMKNEKGDLAVMGLRGENPTLNVIMGSNTTEVLRRGKTPLLIVPGKTKFKPTKHILFACDDPMVKNADTLQPLKEIASIFAAEIEVFMVDETPFTPGQPRQPRPSNLEEYFGKIKHQYTFEMGEGVRERILEAARSSGADMLAMIPHHRSLWAYLFDKSDTLSVALQAKVPMLVLAEKNSENPLAARGSTVAFG